MSIISFQKRSLQWWVLASVYVLLFCHQTHASDSGIKLYRYTNEQGVKVMAHTLPPRYAQKGYEILNTQGKVLEVVPAALSKNELAAAEKERLLLEEYNDLRKRYSSAEDIERARERRLRNIDTNISIIRGNIDSINIRIEGLMKRATELERAGKPVRKRLLDELKDAKSELTVAESSLETRLDDYQKTDERFKREILTFSRGNDTNRNTTQAH